MNKKTITLLFAIFIGYSSITFCVNYKISAEQENLLNHIDMLVQDIGKSGQASKAVDFMQLYRKLLKISGDKKSPVQKNMVFKVRGILARNHLNLDQVKLLSLAKNNSQNSPDRTTFELKEKIKKQNAYKYLLSIYYQIADCIKKSSAIEIDFFFKECEEQVVEFFKKYDELCDYVKVNEGPQESDKIRNRISLDIKNEGILTLSDLRKVYNSVLKKRYCTNKFKMQKKRSVTDSNNHPYKQKKINHSMLLEGQAFQDLSDIKLDKEGKIINIEIFFK